MPTASRRTLPARNVLHASRQGKNQSFSSLTLKRKPLRLEAVDLVALPAR